MAEKPPVDILLRPQVDEKDAKQLEKQLNTRFKKIAKTFGGAMKNAFGKLKGVLMGTIAAGMGAMLTNPIDEIDQKIDELLKKSETISSRAKQLGVSTGELYQASQVAKSAGIEEEDFQAMLTALAVKIGEAKTGADPLLANEGFLKEQSIVKTFFDTLASLNQLAPAERMQKAALIFGEGDVNKLAKLSQIDPEERRRALFKGKTFAQTEQVISQVAAREDEKSFYDTMRETQELFDASKNITSSMLKIQADIADKEMRMRQNDLKNYESLAQLADAQKEAATVLSDLKKEITPLVGESVGWLKKNYAALKEKFF